MSFFTMMSKAMGLPQINVGYARHYEGAMEREIAAYFGF
jgi:hypothetical protein